MDFSTALQELKAGQRISRAGWNGKGMFLWLNKGSHNFKNPDGGSDVNEGDLIEGIREGLFEHGDEGTVTRLPNINMRAATGSTVTGWLASQTDLLAEDWGILK
jgi:hypothetical protein